MTGLHAALAELAAEWADRTPRSDAPRDRRECATVLRALLAEHEPSEITYTYFDRYAYDPMTKASQRLRDEGGVVLDAAGNLVGRVGPARPGNTEGEQVADFAILEREPSGQVDHEQAHRDLRALASDLAHSLLTMRNEGAITLGDTWPEAQALIDATASSTPATAAMPDWRDDKTAQMLGVAQYGCPRCGRGAIENRDAVASALAPIESLSDLWAGRETTDAEYAMWQELRTALADARRTAPATASEGATEIEDGFGGYWTTCGPDCDLQVMRPGKVQCNRACATEVTSSESDTPAEPMSPTEPISDTSSDGHLTGPEQQAARALAEDSSKPGSRLEDAGSTDGDREGLSDHSVAFIAEGGRILGCACGWDVERTQASQAIDSHVEHVLAARLAEVTAERDEAKAERDEARAVRAWVGERGDDHLDRVLRKTTHCDCGGWDQVFELQTESPRPLFGGIRPWKYAGITLKGQSSHARACPKSWRNSPDEKLAHTEARADALAEQVAAIQALHRPDGGIDGPGAMCVSCTADFGTPAEDPTPWPCPTAVVLADPGSALAARDTKVAAQARAELLAKVQDVYDLQCPVRPSEDYTHPAARVAHKWWQTVLGGLLDRERAAGGEVEQP